MTTDTTTRFPSVGRLARWREFFRAPSLARSVVFLLTGALILLLLVNVSTFVMINRTAAYNVQVDATWRTRREARSLILAVQGAETAQRAFLLTGQPGFLTAFEKNKAAIPRIFADFERGAEGDGVALASAEALTRITRDKFIEMSATLELARQGRIGQAVSRVRTGEGQALTEELDAEMSRLDGHLGQTLERRRLSSERSALFTVLINAIAGVLILVLAGIIIMLVRRYLAEITSARDELDLVNAGLEERVKARTAALIRANEEVQRFAYIVSHDLRSPLVNVMGYTSELEQAGKTIDRAIVKAELEREVDAEIITAVREDMPEAIGFIRASTEKMDRLINAILKLSREGRRNLTPETLDMTAMVGRIADSVHHQTEEADAEIVVEALPAFENDRMSIEQVFGNLIDNAVKYLDRSRPGHIVVSGRERPGGWVEYSITDNGRGIAPRDHERVFELFRRAGRQDTKGEGLGLAFVRNSVRRLGGEITLESELGKGSTFLLKFPKRLILDEAGDTL
ncbi:MAG TPA: ATP-binding protein [Brevundimonas sp.]|jgi:signal transduction histidine kinase